MAVQHLFFESVPMLRGVEAPCCVQLSLAMTSGVFAPGELAGLQHLYCIERGLVLHADGGKPRILCYGKTWGELDVILPDALLKYANSSRGRAMTFTEYRGIGREALLNVVERFPRTHRRFRTQAVFVALGRQVVLSARRNRKRTDNDVARKPDLLDQVFRAVTDEGLRKEERALAADTVSGQLMGLDNMPKSPRAMAERDGAADDVVQQLAAIEKRQDERHATVQVQLTKLAASLESVAASISEVKAELRGRSINPISASPADLGP